MMTPTPAASPSANLGAQAHAAGQIKQALIMLETALPHLDLHSPLHAAVRSSINGLAKHLPSGGETGAALQDSMLRDLALRKQQMSPMIAAMQAKQGGGQPGMPGAGAPTPGMPPAPPPGE
jgi:hypothetical protein